MWSTKNALMYWSYWGRSIPDLNKGFFPPMNLFMVTLQMIPLQLFWVRTMSIQYWSWWRSIQDPCYQEGFKRPFGPVCPFIIPVWAVQICSSSFGLLSTHWQDLHSLRFFAQVLKSKAGDSLPVCGCWLWSFASSVVISESSLRCGCTAEATSGTTSALITPAMSCAWRAPFVGAAAALRCTIVSGGFDYQDAHIIEPFEDVRVGDFVALRSGRLDCRLVCTCLFFLAWFAKSCSLEPSSIILRSDPFWMALFTDHSGLSVSLTTVRLSSSACDGFLFCTSSFLRHVGLLIYLCVKSLLCVLLLQVSTPVHFQHTLVHT